MFYINYCDWAGAGVVDTVDLVEEYHTYDDISDYENRGFIILPQEAQTYLFWHMRYYLELMYGLRDKDKSEVSAVLAYVEGRSKDISKLEMRFLSTHYVKNYSEMVTEIRTRFKYQSFGYRSIKKSAYKSFSKLMEVAKSKSDIDWFDEDDTYEREDGHLGSYAWDKIFDDLDKLGDDFCEKFRFQKDLLDEWLVFAYDLDSAC